MRGGRRGAVRAIASHWDVRRVPGTETGDVCCAVLCLAVVVCVGVCVGVQSAVWRGVACTSNGGIWWLAGWLAGWQAVCSAVQGRTEQGRAGQGRAVVTARERQPNLLYRIRTSSSWRTTLAWCGMDGTHRVPRSAYAPLATERVQRRRATCACAPLRFTPGPGSHMRARLRASGRPALNSFVLALSPRTQGYGRRCEGLRGRMW
jgi:hypothetical protein